MSHMTSFAVVLQRRMRSCVFCFRDTFEMKIIRVHDRHSEEVILSSRGSFQPDCLKKKMEFRYFSWGGGGQCKQESNA